MWYDYSIAVCETVFVLTMIPMLVDRNKPPILSAAPIALASLGMALTFLALGYWYSSSTSALLTAGWVVLARQRHRIDGFQSLLPLALLPSGIIRALQRAVDDPRSL